MDDMQTVEVLGLYVDPGSGSAVVLLAQPERGARVLPVFVGPFEATAIAIGIEQPEVARPGTHDLLITHDIQEPFDEAEIEDIVSKFAEFLESAEPEQFGEPPTLSA